MSKNKLVEKKKETQVNGKPEFKDGKLVKPEKVQTVPYKKDGKIKNMDVKKVEKEMLKHKFARDDLTETNKFIAKCKKEIAFCTIKLVKTSKPDEMESQILFRGKKICQICFSKVAYFSQYRFGATEKTIVKPTDEVMLLDCYEWVVSRVQEIEDLIDAKVKAKAEKKVVAKPKIAKTKKTVEENISDIKERIASMSPKSNGIKFPKTVVGNEDWFKELVESEHYKVDTDNRIIMVA